MHTTVRAYMIFCEPAIDCYELIFNDWRAFTQPNTTSENHRILPAKVEYFLRSCSRMIQNSGLLEYSSHFYLLFTHSHKDIQLVEKVNENSTHQSFWSSPTASNENPEMFGLELVRNGWAKFYHKFCQEISEITLSEPLTELNPCDAQMWTSLFPLKALFSWEVLL